MTRSIKASLSRDPTAKPPDDCNTKEGVLNPVILLRRHRKEGRRAGPRGRPELSTSVLVQRSQTVLIPFVIDDSNDIFLLRLDGPVAIGKRNLLGRNPAVAEVSRGNGDAPVQGRGSPSEGLNPVVRRPSEDLRHRAGENGQIGRRSPSPNSARRKTTLLQRVRGPLPIVVNHLNAQNKLPGPPDSGVMDSCLLRAHQLAHEDVLWATYHRVPQQGLGELNAHSAVLEPAKPGGVGRELDGRPSELVVRGAPLCGVLPGDAAISEVSPETLEDGHTTRTPVSQREVRVRREDLRLTDVQPQTSPRPLRRNGVVGVRQVVDVRLQLSLSLSLSPALYPAIIPYPSLTSLSISAPECMCLRSADEIRYHEICASAALGCLSTHCLVATSHDNLTVE